MQLDFVNVRDCMQTVVLVDKKGKKEDVTNYRLISLMCVVSKVLERCLFKHFEEFLFPLFHDAQHGFLQG